MTLQLLISTIDGNIDNIVDMLLEPSEGISYLVSWQHSDGNSKRDIPLALQRDDVTVCHLEGRGLSRNRNNCIDHATADICLIADDDCRYRQEWLNNVIQTFVANPGVDIATFRDNNGIAPNYPHATMDLRSKCRNYYATSFEIAFCRSSVQGHLHFNEMFGLGAPVLHCGEEEIFIHDALKLGLKCRFFPVVAVEHLGASTSVTRIAQNGTLMARGAYLCIAYPWTAIPRIFLISYRLNRHHGIRFWCAVKKMTAGAIYYLKNN